MGEVNPGNCIVSLKCCGTHCEQMPLQCLSSRLRCKRTKVRITQLAVVFIATAAVIYSLEHGLYTFTAVLRSTQPSILRGMVK